MTVTINPRPAINLAPDEIVGWKDIPVSIAVDLEPDCQLDNAIRPLTNAAMSLHFLGPAMTVSCTPPDFGAVVHALDHIQTGDVLVVAAEGNLDTAVVGEILGGHLRNLGCAGLIVDGVVRDIEVLGGFDDFPVYARGVNPRGPIGASEGVVNCAVTIGSRTVSPGDLIIGDRGGLISMPPLKIQAQLAGAQAKIALERQWIDGLRSGKTAKNVFGL